MAGREGPGPLCRPPPPGSAPAPAPAAGEDGRREPRGLLRENSPGAAAASPSSPPAQPVGRGGRDQPPPRVCPGVGGGWGIADSDGKGGGLPLEGGLREGQRRWDAKGKSAARKRGLRGGLGLCFLFALKWWKFGDALARCLHRLRCPSGLMRVVLVWQEGQVAFVGVPEEDCSAAVV